MIKAFTLGSLAGLIFYFFVSQLADPLTVDGPTDHPTLEEATPSPPIQSSDLAAIVAAAAALADPEQIERDALAALSITDRYRRALRLDALLARLSDMDFGRAVRLVERLGLSNRHLERLFSEWSLIDPAAAFSHLGTLDTAKSRQAVAIALLDLHGADDAWVERIRSALPQSDRPLFDIASTEVLLRTDLASFQRGISRLTPSSARMALSRISADAIVDGAAVLLEQVASFEDFTLRSELNRNILATWAAIDPAAAFTYLESAASELPDAALSATIGILAKHDIARLEQLAERLSPTVRRRVSALSIQRMTALAPQEALARVEQMNDSEDKAVLLSTMAREWAKTDPFSAIAWAKTFDREESRLLNEVLRSIADNNRALALDLAMAELAAASTSSNLETAIVSLALRADRNEVEAIANQILAVRSTTALSAVSKLVPLWATRDPDGSLSWAIANAASLDSTVFASIARAHASRDPDRAIDAAASLPPDARDRWVRGALDGLTQRDPEAAARALTATNDPRMHATFAGRIVAQWAVRDAEEATAWLTSATDNGRVSTAGFRELASAWAAYDSAASRRWIRGLPAGAARDAALDGYFEQASLVRSDDMQLLTEYSSQGARSQGVLLVAERVARVDVEQARNLIMQHGDPRFLSTVERLGSDSRGER